METPDTAPPLELTPEQADRALELFDYQPREERLLVAAEVGFAVAFDAIARAVVRAGLDDDARAALVEVLRAARTDGALEVADEIARLARGGATGLEARVSLRLAARDERREAAL